MSISPKNRIVREGQEVKLTCRARGKDIRAVTWFKGKIKLSNKVQSTITRKQNYWTSVLTLRRVTSLNAGTYECRVYKVFLEKKLRKYPGYWPVTTELYVRGEENLHKIRNRSDEVWGRLLLLNHQNALRQAIVFSIFFLWRIARAWHKSTLQRSQRNAFW